MNDKIVFIWLPKRLATSSKFVWLKYVFQRKRLGRDLFNRKLPTLYWELHEEQAQQFIHKEDSGYD